MIQRRFDEELQQLKHRLLSMAGIAEQTLGKTIKALVERNSEMAREVIKDDDQINRLEVEIEDTCINLLARYQPEARDLRFISMVFKIVNDLERVGDQSVNISECTLNLLKAPLLKPLIDIPKMADVAQTMLKSALDAFVNHNADLAREVCRRDDEVDRLNESVFHELIRYMEKDPQTIERAVDLILIGRHIERVADHATNIAEDVFYLVKGIPMKHHLAGE